MVQYRSTLLCDGNVAYEKCRLKNLSHGALAPTGVSHNVKYMYVAMWDYFTASPKVKVTGRRIYI